MAGYAAVLGLEAPSGPDALQNRYLHDLVTASHAPFFRNWLLATNRATVALPVRRFYDLLNVRYYADKPALGTAAPVEVAGMRTLGRYDLDLYENPTAWPRAFFTDTLVPSSGNTDFLRMVFSGDGRPFAAVSPEDLRSRTDADAFAPILRGAGADTARVVVPATGYRLTSRTTSFRLHAPGPGVAVLMEGYQLPYNEQVYLDGKPVPHLRLNEAFTGIRVPGAGEHEVRVVYGPRDLPLLLGVSALGIFLLAGTAWWLRRRDQDDVVLGNAPLDRLLLVPPLSNAGTRPEVGRLFPEEAIHGQK